MDDLVWYRYRCSNCGHVYKSTGQRSVCPHCRSDDVKKVRST
ncbi:MAG: hydrogenase maturation nickel metallochaperone HypA [Methanoregulaceae archaeon]|nr:hydrogenase maturation nickel metallochaperone HypA [Methanoregulaceae archaeon]